MTNYLFKANEANASFRPHEGYMKDKKNFVKNLGILLSQTRNGITGAYLDDNDQVHIQYENDGEDTVNVEGDSYLAIIADVTKRII